MSLHDSRLWRKYHKTVELLREIQYDRCETERRELKRACGVMEMHTYKGLPWDPAKMASFFQKSSWKPTASVSCVTTRPGTTSTSFSRCIHPTAAPHPNRNSNRKPRAQGDFRGRSLRAGTLQYRETLDAFARRWFTDIGGGSGRHYLMRVLLLHNRYRQHGGEDAVVKSEARLLRQMGVEVLESSFSNDVDGEHSFRDTLRLGWRSSWSRDSYHRIKSLCHEFRPDIAHTHNFWMEMSPSVHRACREEGAATVQTIHNFRLLCLNALLKRKGTICEDCVGKVPWRGVARRCYRDSLLASAAVFRMVVANRLRGTWYHDVDAYVALSDHSREKLFRDNLPNSKILVKPNFVEDPGEAANPPSASSTVLFAGRLSEEKGVKVLISAWAHGHLSRRAKLLIVGDGPQRAALEFQAAALNLRFPAVEFTGSLPDKEVLPLMASARAVVMPSVFYECFPRALGEALACGRPVIVSQIGALSEIVSDSFGMRFPAADHALLADAISALLDNPESADRMGRAARQEYLAHYTPEQNFRTLMRIYRFATEQRGKRLPAELEAVQPIGVTA